MARYIDADKFIEWLDVGHLRSPSEICYSEGDVKVMIDMQPTADVAPKSEEGAECPTCYGTGRIGTTNWLTKNISKEQLAKEKAEAIAEHELYIKQEYAREIFEEIEKIFDGKKYVPYPLDALRKLATSYRHPACSSTCDSRSACSYVCSASV